MSVYSVENSNYPYLSIHFLMIDFLTIKYTVLAMWLFSSECWIVYFSPVKSSAMVLRHWFASILWKDMNLELIFSFHGILHIWTEDSFISTVSVLTMYCIRQLLHYTNFVTQCNIVCIPWWLLNGKDVNFYVMFYWLCIVVYQ